MLVHYYEIFDCTCENIDGKPVLVAPQKADFSLLTRYGFVQHADGRWVHFLTQPEYQHVMTGYPSRDVIFASSQTRAAQPQMQNPQMPPPNMQQPYMQNPQTPPNMQTPETPEEKAAGNKMALIGFILLGASFLLNGSSIVVFSSLSDGSSGSDAASVFRSVFGSIGSACGIASFVVMILTRVKYKKNTLGKVLMWIHISLLILAAIGIILLIVACAACVNELRHCPG